MSIAKAAQGVNCCKNKIMPTQLSLLVLRCEDVEKSVAFYRAIGLDFKAEQHGTGPEHFACENAGFVLELYPLRNPKQDPNEVQCEPARLGFRVTSLQNVAEKLQTLAVEAQLKDSFWGVHLLTRDPDGRVVELTEFSTVSDETITE